MSNKLKKMRKEKGITLAQLAQETGLSIGYLCHLEKGSRDNPSLKVCQKIAKTLNSKIEEIFEQ